MSVLVLVGAELGHSPVGSGELVRASGNYDFGDELDGNELVQVQGRDGDFVLPWNHLLFVLNDESNGSLENPPAVIIIANVHGKMAWPGRNQSVLLMSRRAELRATEHALVHTAFLSGQRVDEPEGKASLEAKVDSLLQGVPETAGLRRVLGAGDSQAVLGRVKSYVSIVDETLQPRKVLVDKVEVPQGQFVAFREHLVFLQTKFADGCLQRPQIQVILGTGGGRQTHDLPSIT